MKKLIFLIVVLLPLHAAAESIILKYNGYWEGIKAGDLVFKNVEKGNDYEVITDVNTVSVVKSLTKFSSHTETTGKMENSEYKPNHFISEWQARKGPQKIVVDYKTNGEVAETADPPENRKKRPVVEQVYKQNSFDPISIVFNARRQIHEIIEAGKSLPQKFKVKAFDGRRIFNGNFTVIGYENKRVEGLSQKLLHITIDRTAIAGFNAKELAKLKNFNPLFDIYLDNDYIPVTGSGQAVFGTVEMKLVSKCLGDKCE